MDTQIRINYDTAFGEDDEMSQSDIHNALIAYLLQVFEYLFAGQNVGLFTSIQLYGDPQNPGANRSPDVLVIDNFMSGPDHEITAYHIEDTHVPPRVLMEISSESNWINDLEEKHGIYERMGVLEYFVCDPHIERLWTGDWANEPRLIGWRYNLQSNGFVRIPEELQGLWSQQLQSYLIMEGYESRQLHMYTQTGQRRLTTSEAAQTQAANERIRADNAEERARKLEELLRQLDPNIQLD